jgi:hypothetical protein
VKLRSVRFNNRRKQFEVRVSNRTLPIPYVKLDPAPKAGDLVREAFVDKETGGEAFTYVLESGTEGIVHVEQVLEYNEDPAHLNELLLYRMTVEAQKRVAASSLSRREIIRRMGTSAAQFYRLLDQTNYSKSLSQLLSLLHVLEYEVDFVIRRRRSA